MCKKSKVLKVLQIILCQSCLQSSGDFTKNFLRSSFYRQTYLSRANQTWGFSLYFEEPYKWLSPTEWFVIKSNLQLPGENFGVIHYKACCVFNEVLFWIDNLGVVCLASEFGASALSSKGKEGSLCKVSFCCPTGNPTMPTWTSTFLFALEVVQLSLCLKPGYSFLFC